MRKLKLQVQISIDGFISGSKGEMDWMTFNWDDELKKYVNEITAPVDCIVLGRRLAQGFISHWASRPAEEDPWFVGKMNDSKKVVFTKTLEKSEWTNTILAKGDLLEKVKKLKNEKGNDIIAYGGSSFVSSLIKNGLIDEFHLFVNPVALGKGMSIFKELDSKQRLVLESSKAFSCGIVVLRYRKAT